MDDISSITSRISEIQERIAALNRAVCRRQHRAHATADIFRAGAEHSPNRRINPAAGAVGCRSSFRPPRLARCPPHWLPCPSRPARRMSCRFQQTASGNVDGLVEKYAAQNGLEPSLVRAVIKTESDGNPRCVSRAGAMGLMQLMPDNVKEAGISDPFDPEQNIAAGTKQLAGLMAQYHGNLDLALAGYNAGPGNVRKYGGVPPFTETQNYIRRVRAAMEKG